MMSQPQLVSRIEHLFESMRAQLTMQLSKIDCIALTTDFLSSGNRNLIGITAHWIDPITFNRKITTISCHRATDRHIEHLQTICDGYKISKKITATSTDYCCDAI